MPRVTQECDFTIHEDEPSVCSSAGGNEEGAGGREEVSEGEGESYLEEPAANSVADEDGDQPADTDDGVSHENLESDVSVDHTEQEDEQTPTEAPDDNSQADTTKADDEPKSGRQSTSSSSSRRMSGRTDALIQAAAKAVVARIEKRKSSPDQGEADEEEPEFSTLSFNTEGEHVENESHVENEDDVVHQDHAVQDQPELGDHVEQEDQSHVGHAEQDHEDHIEEGDQTHGEQEASTRGPSPHAPPADDVGADSSSHNGDDDVFSDRSPRSSSGGSMPSDTEHKSPLTETGTPHVRSPRISNMSSYDAEEDFIPASRSTPRPPFRSPSSVRAMQMASPPASVYGSPRSSRSFNRLGSPVQYSPKGRSTPSRLKVQREAPLVLLHVTLLPLAWPWAGIVEAAGEEELSEGAAGLRDVWRQLQSKMGDTVVERGVLLPHPQNDFEMLEERVLESLELPLKRRARILECGHYLGPSNIMSVEDSGSESDELDDDSDSGSSREERHWCKTCQHEIRCEALGPGRVFRVKVYASNGLMKAGAWEACWKEMERVDVEIEPWIEAGVQGELGRLATEQERRAEEAYLEQEKREQEAYLEQERREQEAYLERERDDTYMEEPEYEVGGDGPLEGNVHGMEEQSTMPEPEPEIPGSPARSPTPARHSTGSNDRSLLSPDQEHTLDEPSPEALSQERSTSVINRGSTDVIPATAEHEMQLEERNVVAEKDAHIPHMPIEPPAEDPVDERALPEAEQPHLLEEPPNTETQIEQRSHSSVSHHDVHSSPRDSHLQIEDGGHAALEDTPAPAIERSHSSISRRETMDSPRNSLQIEAHPAEVSSSAPAIEQRSHSSISRHDQLSAPVNPLQIEDRRRSAGARSSTGHRDSLYPDTERRRRDEERLREIYGHAPRSPSPEGREVYAPPSRQSYTPQPPSQYERRESQGYRESQYERETRHEEFDKRERGRAYKDASLPELLCEAAKVFLMDGKNLVILLLGGLVLMLVVTVGGGGRGQEVLGRGQEVFERGQEMFARMEMPRMQVPRMEIPRQETPRMEVPRYENPHAEQVHQQEVKPPVREPQTLTEREVVRVMETVTETVKVTATEQAVEVETARVAAVPAIPKEPEKQAKSVPSEAPVEPEAEPAAQEPLNPVADIPVHEEL